jgi:hypothetical protein
MTILLLILWTLCAVACYFIADRKHNHPVHALFTGLLLGPIGVIAVALWKDSPDA